MRFRIYITGFLLILFWSFSAPGALASSFSDTNNHKYSESIEFLKSRSIVEGYSDGTYKPEGAINRAEMLKIILGATSTEATIGNKANCFTDVKSAWYSKYVCHAKDRSIVKGYSTGHFRPAQEVNMAEGLKMALGTFESGIQESSGEEWYSPYTDFVHDNNIFSKYDYFPSRSMTRGEMSFLVHQLILEKEGSITFDGKRENLSAGCGVTPPSATPTSSVVSGVERSYITVIPSNYNKNEPTKLIFAFHGRTNPNTMVRTYYKVEEASRGEVIMIYPAGLPAGSGSRNWSNPGDAPDQLRDFTLFDQLLEEFSNNYCIDLDHVYVVGHSLGSWFTNSLGCFRGDVIRGIGSLGGGTTIGGCTGPIAAMTWHNPADRLSPFSQGITARDQILGQNRCGSNTTPVEPSAGNCVQYSGCFDHAPTIWCPHNIDHDNRGVYYPHTWPNITGPAIWDFLKSLKD